MLKTEDELRGELIKAQLELQSAINKGAIESNDINSLKAAQKDLQDTVGHKENLISSLQLQMKKLEEAFNEEKDNLQQSVYHFRGEYESEMKRSKEAETLYVQLKHFADTKDAECIELRAELQKIKLIAQKMLIMLQMSIRTKSVKRHMMPKPRHLLVPTRSWTP